MPELNHVPAFGEVEEGLYSACCENGLGTVKSTLAGMMAADLATGTRSEDLEKYQDQPKPSRLPPEPVARLGARAVIRWQEIAGRPRRLSFRGHDEEGGFGRSAEP